MNTRQAATVVLLAMVLTGCAGTAPAPAEAPASAAPSPTAPAPTPAPTTPAAQPRALPVYYVADTPAGLRLYREFHRVATSDPGSAAVREMLARPTGADPDYRTLWPAGTRLWAPVATAPGVITVDLTGVTSGAQVGSEGAELTVQQLVFTVQAAVQSTDPVRILLDGQPVPELFGAVATAEPVRRADRYAVRSLVQIDAPAHGATVGRVVTVSGEAAVFEANVLWEVRRGGSVVQSGFTMTTEGQRFAPFRFTVELEPGEYVVRITEDDPSDGQGHPALTDDKTITVTG